MQHLLVISVGPVQDFIAAARRSRDLWFGSWLLSDLVRAAAREVVEAEGGRIDSLIFPAAEDAAALQSDELAVSNKVVALISSPPDVVGPRVEEAIHRRLQGVWRDARSELGEPLTNEAAAEAQIAHLPEIYWVAVPISDASTYAEQRKLADALLAARKVTRDFTPVSWGGNQPKSSLDGARESVIPKHVYVNGNEQLQTRYRIKWGEQLSAVDLLKRHGRRGEEESFLSTSHVAALSLLQRLPETAKETAQQYFDTLRELEPIERLPEHGGSPHPVFKHYDGELLFEERLVDFFAGEALHRARAALHAFLRKATDNKRPLPYYAILIADGDRMGAVISAQKSRDDHQTLSQALARFAAEARTIVENQHQGSLIYSGGDDVLAFLPLHTALDCASTLAAEFAKRLKRFEDEKSIPPTLSVGIAVAHHLAPLSDALALARDAERRAKQRPGKNALAVTVSKRSGADRMVVGSWGEFNKRLRLFIRLHRWDALPDGAAYDLMGSALRLQPPSLDEQQFSEEKRLAYQEQKNLLIQVARAEAERILSRKRAQRGQKELAETLVTALRQMLPSSAEEKVGESARISIDVLARELIVARLFADAEELADVTLPNEEEALCEYLAG